jgi:pyruvate/2-oxoacid:ferredoxin oxidoreductase beta subunit
MRYTINREPALLPVGEYFKLQGRFRHLTAAQAETIQHNLEREWQWLRARAQLTLP